MIDPIDRLIAYADQPDVYDAPTPEQLKQVVSEMKRLREATALDLHKIGLLDALASTAGTTPEKMAAQILARGIETQAARLMNAKEYAG